MGGWNRRIEKGKDGYNIILSYVSQGKRRCTVNRRCWCEGSDTLSACQAALLLALSRKSHDTYGAVLT